MYQKRKKQSLFFKEKIMCIYIGQSCVAKTDASKQQLLAWARVPSTGKKITLSKLKPLSYRKLSYIPCSLMEESVTRKKLDVQANVKEIDTESKQNRKEQMRLQLTMLLENAKTIPQKIQVLDRQIKHRKFGFQNDYNYQATHTALCQVSNLVDLLEQRNQLLNAWVWLKHLAHHLNLADFELLRDVYLRKLPKPVMLYRQRCSLRSLYRKMNDLLQKLTNLALLEQYKPSMVAGFNQATCICATYA